MHGGSVSKPIHKLYHLHSLLYAYQNFFFPLMVSMVTWFLELVAKKQPLRQSCAVVISGL